jgi:hypothetical protein
MRNANQALLPAQASDVGRNRVDFFRAQNDVRHGAVRGAEKDYYGKVAHRRHTADVHETRCIGVWSRSWRRCVSLMAGAADRLGKVPANGRIDRLCARRGDEPDGNEGKGSCSYRFCHCLTPKQQWQARAGGRFPEYSWQDCNSCKPLRTSMDFAFNDVGPSRLVSHLNDGLARHIVLNPQQVYAANLP